MSAPNYDLIIIGGGIAGSSLGLTMARTGSSVLILERETRFRDRIRGEWISPWGAEEAYRLDIWSDLQAGGAEEIRYMNFHQEGQLLGRQDLPEATAVKRHGIAFSHPKIQESLLAAAKQAGASVVRGARVTRFTEEGEPTAEYETLNGAQSVSARLVVGADGRDSMFRRSSKFSESSDPDSLQVAGVLLSDVNLELASAFMWHDRAAGLLSLFFPRRGELTRGYLEWHGDRYPTLSGEKSLQDFISGAIRSGAPGDVFENAKLAGPLATFAGADSWVENVAHDGYVLIGDAAAASDPTWGHGVSLTLRDTRVLSEALKSTDDWNSASLQYANSHREYYKCLHTHESWNETMFFPEGDNETKIVETALTAQKEDPSRRINMMGAGPDLVLDEEARRRFFGE